MIRSKMQSFQKRIGFLCCGDGIKALNISKGDGDPLICKSKAVSLLCLHPFRVPPLPSKLKARSFSRHRGPFVTQVLNTSPAPFPTNLYLKFHFSKLNGCMLGHYLPLPMLVPLPRMPFHPPRFSPPLFGSYSSFKIQLRHPLL